MTDCKINWWNIEIGQEEIDGVTAAINNRHISQGVITEEFEFELARALEVPHVVCVTSGTAALLVSSLATGIKPGDEVIVPDRTFVATAHAPMLLGARARIVDTKEKTPVIDEDLIEDVINNKTKAIFPVHLNGHAANMVKINAIASRHGISVIEDACPALYSRSPEGLLGTLSRFGCFSLGMAKIITTGQGGFITCHDTADYETVKKIRNQGVFNVFKDKDYSMLSGNFKYTDLQASIGLVQLKKLSQKINHQKEIYKRYLKGFEHIGCLQVIPIDTNNGELALRPEYLCTERDGLTYELSKYNIDVASHTNSLCKLPHIKADTLCPHSEKFYAHTVIFPCGPDQPLENVDKTIAIVQSIASKFRSW